MYGGKFSPWGEGGGGNLTTIFVVVYSFNEKGYQVFQSWQKRHSKIERYLFATFLKRQIDREYDTSEKRAKLSHKQNIEKYNSYLAAIPEQNDMKRINSCKH